MSGPSLVIGDKYKDRTGTVWTVNDRWELYLGDPAHSASWSRIERTYGPLVEAEDDPVDHPPHYQTATGLEAIDVIEAFFADNYHLGNVFKYLARAGKKGNAVEDLHKAAWYVSREISRLEAEGGAA